MKKISCFILVIFLFLACYHDDQKNIKKINTTCIVATKMSGLKMIIKMRNTNDITKENYEDIEQLNDTSDFSSEIIGDNISIPKVCENAFLTVGSTQGAVDKNDICLMTEAAGIFGEGKEILLGGHNTKSLKYLYKSSINDIITVNFSNCIYRYRVIYSNECSTDGYGLFDIETGENMLLYNCNEEVLNIYTCYNSNNWLVKAILLD